MNTNTSNQNTNPSAQFLIGGEIPVNRLGYGAMRRSHEAILDYTTAHNIAFIPYGSLGAHPLRRGAPLAQAEGVLAQIAQVHGANPTQIALAWLPHRAPNILLIPGTTTVAHLEDNVQAASISLSDTELAQLNSLQRGTKTIAHRCNPSYKGYADAFDYLVSYLNPVEGSNSFALSQGGVLRCNSIDVH